MEVVAAVSSATELLDAVAQLAPDAVIADIRMPPGHRTEGIEAAHEIRNRYPNMGVVVLSQYTSPLYALTLFKSGTAGLAYILKDRVGDLDELLRALREVMAGRSVIDPQVVEGLLARRSHRTDSPLARLTPRELDVLGAMAQGRSNLGIAQELVVSESAVEKHVNSIFAKLGLAHEPVTHRRVAAVLAFLNGQATGENPDSHLSR